jgi:hypothetical protein
MAEAINNKEGVPLKIYQERYETLDPAEIVRRTGAAFDCERGVFKLTLLSHALKAAWPEFKLSAADPDGCPAVLTGGEASILMIRYLSEGAQKKAGGTWLSYRELPWGDVYDSNFQGRCVKRLAYSFGSKLDAFARGCEKLGGVRADKGDKSYDLPFLPGLTIRLIVWAGDDEFPPSSQFLFSDNMPKAFTAEDAAAVGDIVIGALKAYS